MIRNANDIIDSTDILEVIQRHLVVRKVSGQWVARCPWHNAEAKSTAFTISPDKGTWYCFGCGGGGNVLGFLAVAEGLTNIGGDIRGTVRDNFAHLVESLAAHTGHTLEYDQAASTGPRRQDLYAAVEAAVALYHASLRDTDREHLHARGFTDARIDKYQLGYATSAGANDLANEHGKAALIAAGLIKEGRNGAHYDPVHDRLTIPFHDHIGRPIGFTGRALADDQQPKYLNTSDTAIYRKGKHLYNLHRIEKGTKIVHVIEGQLKAIAMHETGHPCVSPGGTSLTDSAIAQLQGYTLRIVADPDAAGRRAAAKHITALRAAKLAADIAVITPGDDGNPLKDPDDYLAANRPFTVETVDWLTWLWETFAEPLSDEAQATAVRETIIPVIAAHPDPLNIDAALKRFANLSDYRITDLRAGIATRPPDRPRPSTMQDAAPKTTGQVLAAIALNLPLDPEDPNAWESATHWTSYQPELRRCLSDIAAVRALAAHCQRNIPDAITLRTETKWSNLLYTWATQPMPFPITPESLAECDARLHSTHTQQIVKEILA